MLGKKGFTLIEIIVTLAISSILFLVVSALLVNMFGFYTNTELKDVDKGITEKISSFIQDRIVYATDVRVIDDGLSPHLYDGDDAKDWHSIYVMNNQLYHDDVEVFQKSFYNKRKLTTNVRAYQSNRMDVVNILTDTGDDERYKASFTLELLNLKMYTENNKSFQPLPGSASSLISLSNKVRIYYTTSTKAVGKLDGPQDTIEDEIENINILNNRFDYEEEKKLYTGDYIFYDGCWWMFVKDLGPWGDGGEIINKPPNASDTALFFRKIDASYDPHSAYLKNDVIIYNDEYYVCKKDLINRVTVPPTDNAESLEFWQLIPQSDAKNYKPELPKSTNPYATIKQEENLMVFKFKDLIIGHEDEIKGYSGICYVGAIKEHYTTDDIVKIKDDNYAGIYRYFIPVFSNTCTEPLALIDKNTYWKEIRADYNPNSYYSLDDGVFYIQDKMMRLAVSKRPLTDLSYTFIPPTESKYWDIKALRGK